MHEVRRLISLGVLFLGGVSLLAGCGSTNMDIIGSIIGGTPPRAHLKNLGVPLGDGLWNGSQYLVVGDRGTVFVSRDGNQWNRYNVGSASNLWGVDYGGGTYVAVGGYANPYVFLSADGENWHSVRTNAPDFIYDVDYDPNSGKFYAAAGTNTKGGVVIGQSENWRYQDTASPKLVAVKVVNGTIITAGGRGTVVLSEDGGATWIPQSGASYINFVGIAAGKGEVVLAGGNGGGGYIVTTTLSQKDWSNVVYNSPFDLWDVGYGNGVFLAVGEEGTILKSNDGYNWQSIQSVCDETVPSEWWHDVSFNDGLFVITGWRGHVLIAPSSCF